MKNVNTIAGFGFFLIGFLLATNVIPLSYQTAVVYSPAQEPYYGSFFLNGDVPDKFLLPNSLPNNNLVIEYLQTSIFPNATKNVYANIHINQQNMGNLSFTQTSTPRLLQLKYTLPSYAQPGTTIRFDFYIVWQRYLNVPTLTTTYRASFIFKFFGNGQTVNGPIPAVWSLTQILGDTAGLIPTLYTPGGPPPGSTLTSTTSSSSTTSNSQTSSSTSQSTTQSNPQPFNLSLNQTLGFASMLVGVLLIYRGRRSM